MAVSVTAVQAAQQAEPSAQPPAPDASDAPAPPPAPDARRAARRQPCSDPPIDPRTLECFLVAAEELHIGRAAARLRTGPGAVDRAIRLLERRAGADLLTRTTPGGDLALTAAGEAMREGARDLLDHHDRMLGEVRRAARLQRRSLSVLIDGAFAGLTLAAAVRRYRLQEPEAQVRLRSAPHGAAAEDLLADGGADAALIGAAPRSIGVRTRAVGRARRLALVSAEHRLAGRSSVRLADLRGERELRAAGASEQWRAQWSIAALLGERPRWCAEIDLFAEAPDLIASCDGVMLAPDLAAQRFARPDLRWLPVADLEPVAVHLAWSRRHVAQDRVEALASAFEHVRAESSPGGEAAA